MKWDHQTFDLTGWKLTLPVDEDYFSGGGDYTDGRAYEVKPAELEGFVADEFFYYDEDQGGMVFRADVEGATTSSGTRYTRSELREMDGDDRAAWTIDDGGTLSAHLKVTELAEEFDGGAARVIVGQIHGKNDELVRLYYNADGDLYYANEITGDDGDERKFFFENADGERPNVSLGEDFSYLIDVSDGKLTVQVYADGEVYSAVPTDGLDPTEIVDAWQDDTFYFKAGVYQGVNDSDGHGSEGTGTTEAVFYDIDYSHTPGAGREAWMAEGGASPVAEKDVIVEESVTDAPVEEEVTAPPVAESPEPPEEEDPEVPVEEETADEPAAQEPTPEEPVVEEVPATPVLEAEFDYNNPPEPDSNPPEPTDFGGEEPVETDEDNVLAEDEPFYEEPEVTEDEPEEPVFEEEEEELVAGPVPDAQEEPEPIVVEVAVPEEPQGDDGEVTDDAGSDESSGGGSWLERFFELLSSLFGGSSDDRETETAREVLADPEAEDAVVSMLSEIVPVTHISGDCQIAEDDCLVHESESEVIL